MFTSEQDLYKAFGDRLLLTRSHARLTMTAVAEVAGVNRKTWASYERGYSAPDAIHLQRLKEAYGWDLI